MTDLDALSGFFEEMRSQISSELLRMYSDKYLIDYLQSASKRGDQEAIDMVLDIIKRRSEIRKEFGGKYIKIDGRYSEVVWKEGDDYWFADVGGDDDILQYNAFRMSKTWEKDAEQQESKSKRGKFHNQEGGELHDGSPYEWRSANPFRIIWKTK